MGNNKKLLTYQLQKKANFCKQNYLPLIGQKGKKHDKSHKIYSHKKYKRYKNNFVKPNDFYVSGKYKQLGKFKNNFNMLKIINKDQKELFKILESNNSSNSLEDDFSSLNLLNLLKIIPYKNIKFVKTLTKSKENEKSTLSFKEPLQHEINIIKQEISELKHKNKNINPELIKQEISELKHKNKNNNP